MNEPGSQGQRGQAEQADARIDAIHRPSGGGETIQFGGLPIRWPFGEPRLLRRVRAYLAGRVGSGRRTAVIASLTALIVGLLIGFGAGHSTVGSSRNAAEPASSNSSVSIRTLGPPIWLTAAIAATGQQCASQVGKDLQLGIEIENTSNIAITVGRIIPEFPMGGLRAISTGLGVCGELPTAIPTRSLFPGHTEWINAMVAVRVKCPEPYPVAFKVEYSLGRIAKATVIGGFSDLGPVSYLNCAVSRLDARFSALNADAVETP